MKDEVKDVRMSKKRAIWENLPSIFYYSFVIATAFTVTSTLILTFFTKSGWVSVGEPNLIIKVTEILIGFALIYMTFGRIRRDILERVVRKLKGITVDYDEEEHVFFANDPSVGYWSSIPFGDIIIDLNKDGQIGGFEVLNADKLRINMNEHEEIVKMLEEAEDVEEDEEEG